MSTFEAELRICCLLRHQVVEFKRAIHLPFPPVPYLFFHEGPPPVPSLRFRDVSWLADEERFIVQTDDDLDAAADFGDDVAALTTWYESLGWQVYNSGPIAFVVVPHQEDEDDEDNTLLEDPEEDWSDLQEFLGGESA
jgi:hypothetical protein